MLIGKVIKIENEEIQIEIANGHFFVCGILDCEGTPKIGQDVNIIIAVPGSEDAGRQKLSTHLLNTLLKE